MDTFNFPYHTPVWTYPKGTSFKFGQGYQFSAKALRPPQRTFHLKFVGMMWFFNDAGEVDATIEPTLNMKALVDFYEAHLSDTSFIYPHPVFGNLEVKFSADNPWQTPEAIPGGSGMTESFELELIEQM